MLDEPERGNGIFGTTGRLKSGHYSLNCDWTAWLWAHGGSVFDGDGYFSGNDADGMRGLSYMLELVKHMSPEGHDVVGEPGQRRNADVLRRVLPSLGRRELQSLGLMEAARPPVEASYPAPTRRGSTRFPTSVY